MKMKKRKKKLNFFSFLAIVIFFGICRLNILLLLLLLSTYTLFMRMKNLLFAALYCDIIMSHANDASVLIKFQSILLSVNDGIE